MISRAAETQGICIMNDLADERRITAEPVDHRQDDVLWSIAVLTDGELLSASYRPLSEWLPQVERVRRHEGGHLVFESSLPEIRCLAMLLAASRIKWDGAVIAARIADAADWLAARVQVLGWSHVEVSLEQLPILDLANQRLQRMCARSGLAEISVLPILQVRAPSGTPIVMRGWSRLPISPMPQLTAECL